MIIGREYRGLNDIDLATPHIFKYANEQVTFRKPQNFRPAKADIQVITNLSGKAAAATASKNQHLVGIHFWHLLQTMSRHCKYFVPLMDRDTNPGNYGKKTGPAQSGSEKRCCG